MRLLPVLAAAAASIQVGAAIAGTRFVIDEIAPAQLAFFRYLIGASCLAVPALLAARHRPSRRDLLPIALLGVGQFGVLIALLNFALQTVSAARGALLFATFPALTLVFGAMLGRERFGWPKALGVLLTMAGVGATLGPDALGGGAGSGLGEAATLAAAACGALCSVLYRPYLDRYGALPVSALAMLASAVFLAFLAALERAAGRDVMLTTSGWVVVISIGVSSAAAYWAWLWALGRTTPTRVTVFLALSPVTATALGAWFLAEPVSTAIALGVAGVSTGLWVATRPDPAERAAALAKATGE